MGIPDILSLICGLAFFLFGMNVMSSGLEKMAGGKLEQLLQEVTRKSFLSILLGAGLTIAVQSSSAITVMLVGLVNSGVMQFAQTISVIFGANIGTTVTAWITATAVGGSSEWTWTNLLKPEGFSPIIAIIGVVMIMMAKNDKKKNIGRVFVGFAILMEGMSMMAGSVNGLSDNPEFCELMQKFDNPIIGILIGLLITAVIQSSAASVAMLQSLAATGVITWGMAIPIVLGQNIGTCITAVISCIGTSPKAKRVAFVHTLIKVIGTIVIMLSFGLLNMIFKWAFVGSNVDAFGVALIHTIFNILNTAILLPFSKYLIRISEFVIRDKAKAESTDEPVLLDERLLRSPSVAIVECNNASNKMCELASDTMYLAIGLFTKYDSKVVETIYKNEDEIDKYEDELSTYLVKLSAEALSDKDSQVISKILHAVGDFERLGDHAVNLVKVAQEIHDKNISFTEQAQEELRVLMNAISEILNITATAYTLNNLDIAAKVEPLEQVIDVLTSKIKSNHINRLKNGNCTIEMGFILSDMLTNFERISDHCSNIAVAIIEVVHNSFDTHKYLNGVKYGNSTFNEIYDRYEQKYHL